MVKGAQWGHGGSRWGSSGAAAGGSWSEQAWAEGAFLARRARGQGTWEGVVGPAGSGCAWERPEHSLQTDSAARPPRPAYLPPLGEGVGRRAGPHSHLPRAWGGSAPGRAGSSHPAFQLGALYPVVCAVTLGPWAGPPVPSPLGSPGSKEAPFLQPGARPLFAHKSLASLLPPPPEITRHVGQIPSCCSPTSLARSLLRDQQGPTCSCDDPHIRSSMPRSPMGWAEAAPLPEPTQPQDAERGGAQA